LRMRQHCNLKVRLFLRATISCGSGMRGQAPRAADEGITAFVKTQELIGSASDTDADSFSDCLGGVVAFREPKRALSAEIKTVVTSVDLKSGRKASRAAGEIEEPSGLAVLLHELDALEGFERSDKDSGGDSGALAHDIKHEMRAIIEENVGMAGSKIHRANAWSRAAEVMSGGIARRIGLRFHDAATQAAGGEIVNDNFSNEAARQLDGISRKLCATKTADH